MQIEVDFQPICKLTPAAVKKITHMV